LGPLKWGGIRILKEYTRYTYDKIDLKGIPKVFLVFSLITRLTNFVKIPIFIGYLLLNKMNEVRVLSPTTNQHYKKKQVLSYKMIDNHIYIPTKRLLKEKRKRSEYRVYPLKNFFS